MDEPRFTHRHASPRAAVRAPAWLQEAPPPPRRPSSGRTVLLVVGVLAVLIVGTSIAAAVGRSSASTGNQAAAGSSAADTCTRNVTTIMRNGLANNDIAAVFNEILVRYGMQSPESTAFAHAQNAGLQTTGFKFGADVAVQQATPTVAAACEAGYGSRPAATDPQPTPTDSCSAAAFQALGEDLAAGTLGEGAGFRRLAGTYGSESPEYHAYVAALPTVATTSAQEGYRQGLSKALPEIETACG